LNDYITLGFSNASQSSCTAIRGLAPTPNTDRGNGGGARDRDSRFSSMPAVAYNVPDTKSIFARRSSRILEKNTGSHDTASYHVVDKSFSPEERKQLLKQLKTIIGHQLPYMSKTHIVNLLFDKYVFHTLYSLIEIIIQ